MNRKRNVSYLKPEDPEFLKVFKRQAGYDDKNHKFDDLQNAEDDFAEDDDSEKPQVIVLEKGDLTAEEAESEQKRIEHLESNTKADLTQRIIFNTKQKPNDKGTNKRKSSNAKHKDSKKSRQLLSFDNDDEED